MVEHKSPKDRIKPSAQTADAPATAKELEAVRQKLERDLVEVSMTIKNFNSVADFSSIGAKDIEAIRVISDKLAKRQEITKAESAGLLKIRQNLAVIVKNLDDNKAHIDVQVSDIVKNYKDVINDVRLSDTIRKDAVTEVSKILRSFGHKVDDLDLTDLSRSNDSLDRSIAGLQAKGQTTTYDRLRRESDLAVRTHREIGRLNNFKVGNSRFAQVFQDNPGSITKGTIGKGILGSGFASLGLGSIDEQFNLSGKAYDAAKVGLSSLFGKKKDKNSAINRYTENTGRLTPEQLAALDPNSPKPKPTNEPKTKPANDPKGAPTPDESTPSNNKPRGPRRPSEDAKYTAKLLVDELGKQFNITNEKLDQLVKLSRDGHAKAFAGGFSDVDPGTGTPRRGYRLFTRDRKNARGFSQTPSPSSSQSGNSTVNSIDAIKQRAKNMINAASGRNSNAPRAGRITNISTQIGSQVPAKSPEEAKGWLDSLKDMATGAGLKSVLPMGAAAAGGVAAGATAVLAAGAISTADKKRRYDEASASLNAEFAKTDADLKNATASGDVAAIQTLRAKRQQLKQSIADNEQSFSNDTYGADGAVLPNADANAALDMKNPVNIQSEINDRDAQLKVLSQDPIKNKKELKRIFKERQALSSNLSAILPQTNSQAVPAEASPVSPDLTATNSFQPIGETKISPVDPVGAVSVTDFRPAMPASLARARVLSGLSQTSGQFELNRGDFSQNGSSEPSLTSQAGPTNSGFSKVSPELAEANASPNLIHIPVGRDGNLDYSNLSPEQLERVNSARTQLRGMLSGGSTSEQISPVQGSSSPEMPASSPRSFVRTGNLEAFSNSVPPSAIDEDADVQDEPSVGQRLAEINEHIDELSSEPEQHAPRLQALIKRREKLKRKLKTATTIRAVTAQGTSRFGGSMPGIAQGLTSASANVGSPGRISASEGISAGMQAGSNAQAAGSGALSPTGAPVSTDGMTGNASIGRAARSGRSGSGSSDTPSGAQNSSPMGPDVPKGATPATSGNWSSEAPLQAAPDNSPAMPSVPLTPTDKTTPSAASAPSIPEVPTLNQGVSAPTISSDGTPTVNSGVTGTSVTAYAPSMPAPTPQVPATPNSAMAMEPTFGGGIAQGSGTYIPPSFSSPVTSTGVQATGGQMGGALGNTIAKGEGGYGSFNRGIAGDARGAKMDFSNMTVGQIMQQQALPMGDPNRLFAVGKYQVIPKTMQGAIASGAVSKDDKFTPEVQEKVGRDYLMGDKRPEVRDYITGKSDNLVKAQRGMAYEFASVGAPEGTTYNGRQIATGASVYGGSAGNKASTSPEKIADALNADRATYQQILKDNPGISSKEAYSRLSAVKSATTEATSNNEAMPYGPQQPSSVNTAADAKFPSQASGNQNGPSSTDVASSLPGTTGAAPSSAPSANNLGTNSTTPATSASFDTSPTAFSGNSATASNATAAYSGNGAASRDAMYDKARTVSSAYGEANINPSYRENSFKGDSLKGACVRGTSGVISALTGDDKFRLKGGNADSYTGQNQYLQKSGLYGESSSIPKDYKPRIGDVVASTGGGRGMGHIQVYDGKQWVSDGRQPNGILKNHYDNFTLHRLNDSGLSKLNPDYVKENDTNGATKGALSSAGVQPTGDSKGWNPEGGSSPTGAKATPTSAEDAGMLLPKKDDTNSTASTSETSASPDAVKPNSVNSAPGQGIDATGNQQRSIAPNSANNVAMNTKGVDFMGNQPRANDLSSEINNSSTTQASAGTDLGDIRNSGGDVGNSASAVGGGGESAGGGGETGGGESEGGDGGGDSESLGSSEVDSSSDTNSSVTSSGGSDMSLDDSSDDSSSTQAEKEGTTNSSATSSDNSDMSLDDNSDDSSSSSQADSTSTSSKADNTETREASSKAVPDSTETQGTTAEKKSSDSGDRPIQNNTTNNNTNNSGGNGGTGKEDRSARINDSDLQIFAYQMFQA